MHARVLAAGPETRLTAVWARRPEAAAALAAEHGATAAGSFEELLDTCEAVAFAVPRPSRPRSRYGPPPPVARCSLRSRSARTWPPRARSPTPSPSTASSPSSS
ncbi:hypothetical protein [Streptomyces sp. SA3_actG]|uniref:hypothetical protein n=1 Tax=Streptomyces sp. SA3_actG TaxID=683219 RepID=UPI00020003D7